MTTVLLFIVSLLFIWWLARGMFRYLRPRVWVISYLELKTLSQKTHEVYGEDSDKILADFIQMNPHVIEVSIKEKE